MKHLPLLILLFPPILMAGIDTDLDRMFESLSNATQPSASLGQRRGVLSGGSVVIRNRILQTHPVTLTPPAMSGGCGGIDLYGGSFSFINQSEFTGLLRSIAANAGGYAFQLGINAMCPDCGSLMSDLQKKIQSLNEHLANSCQLAQGIVNEGISAIDAQQRNRISEFSLARGMGDAFQSFSHAAGDPLTRIARDDPALLRQRVTGNLIWRALKQERAAGWSTLGGDNFLEGVMSVTGTIIIRSPSGTPSSSGSGQSLPVIRLPPLLGVREFLNGSQPEIVAAATVQRYQCDTPAADGCLSPTSIPLEIRGFTARIETLIGGQDGTGGIVQKFATGQGTFTEAELSFMARTPQSIGALIRNLAREDPSLARLFVQEAGPILAAEMAGDLLEEMIEAVIESTRIEDHPYQSMLQTALAETLLRLREERHGLESRLGTSSGLIAHYQTLMQTGKGHDYGLGAPLAHGARRSPS